MLEIRAVHIKRIEYAAVIIVAMINIMTMIQFVWLNIHISMIMSFE